MNGMGTIAAGLQAAWLFARGRSDGLRYLAPDQAGTARSFWALPLTLPAAICLRLMAWVQFGLPPQAGHEIGLELLGFVVGWLGYAVLTFHLLRFIGMEQRWPRFIIAWNWCNVIENLLLVGGGIPGLLGAPAVVSQAMQLFAIGWALWVEWFAIRLSLQANALIAAWLVVLDQALGLLLMGIGS